MLTSEKTFFNFLTNDVSRCLLLIIVIIPFFLIVTLLIFQVITFQIFKIIIRGGHSANQVPCEAERVREESA